jgi:hypothetical protein
MLGAAMKSVKVTGAAIERISKEVRGGVSEEETKVSHARNPTPTAIHRPAACDPLTMEEPIAIAGDYSERRRRKKKAPGKFHENLPRVRNRE